VSLKKSFQNKCVITDSTNPCEGEQGQDNRTASWRAVNRQKKYRFLFAVEMTGGNATWFQNLKDAISGREDVDSTWLPIELEPGGIITRIPPISLNWTLRGGLVTRRRVRLLERSGLVFDAALFHHHVIATFLCGFACGFARRVPTVISLDATPVSMLQYGRWYKTSVASPNSMIRQLKRSITRSVYANAVHLLPFSGWAKKSLIRDYGMQEDKITVVPPSINLRKWKGVLSISSECSQRRLRVLFVGADFVRKGGDLLVRIAKRQEFQNCEFHFVTRSFSGPPGQNIFVHSNLGINSQPLIDLYCTSDVFVLPTRADLSSWALLEAMATRLPVISTGVGGVPEIIIDGQTGYLVEPDDEEALADRLRMLLHEPDLRRRFARNGRERVERHFDLEKNAEVIVECLKLASGRGAL
jgi:glycosyltransferase involved in cell wall biosynthesis